MHNWCVFVLTAFDTKPHFSLQPDTDSLKTGPEFLIWPAALSPGWHSVHATWWAPGALTPIQRLDSLVEERVIQVTVSTVTELG